MLLDAWTLNIFWVHDDENIACGKTCSWSRQKFKRKISGKVISSWEVDLVISKNKNKVELVTKF